MISERQKTILYAVVQEYTKTARPVASKGVTRNLGIKISAATIRSEMQGLDDQGFLEQPHTSAGRVPTDRGYRFFVDYAPEKKILNSEERKLVEDIFSCTEEEEFVRELGRTVSRISGMFTAAGIHKQEIFYETGFSCIMEEPEFRDAEPIKLFGKLLDLWEDEIRELYDSLLQEPDAKIFIGKENPLKEAQYCTMVLFPWSHPQGFEGFLAMLGPRRTNYQKHKDLLNEINQYAR